MKRRCEAACRTPLGVQLPSQAQGSLLQNYFVGLQTVQHGSWDLYTRLGLCNCILSFARLLSPVDIHCDWTFSASERSLHHCTAWDGRLFASKLIESWCISSFVHCLAPIVMGCSRLSRPGLLAQVADRLLLAYSAQWLFIATGLSRRAKEACTAVPHGMEGFLLPSSSRVGVSVHLFIALHHCHSVLQTGPPVFILGLLLIL